MNPEQPMNLQPMTIMEIFSRSIRFYRDNFLKLVGIVIPGSVIVLIIYLLIFANQYGEMGSTVPAEAAQPPETIAVLYVVMTLFIALFVSSVVTAAGTIVISERFLDREISIGQAYLRVLDVLFPLLGTLILAAIAIYIGLMLFFVPGIIVYVWFCLIPPVVMIEGEGGLGALKRSRVIVKDYFRKASLVALLVIIEILVASSPPNLLSNLPSLYYLSSFFSIFLLLLIEPFKIAATTMLYYDLRTRKEGYSLQVMAEELADPP